MPVLRVNSNMDQALDRVSESLAKAKEAGSFMVAVWRVEGNEVHLDRHTWEFPVGRFKEAEEMLGKANEREVSGSVEPDLLPIAEWCRGDYHV